MPTYKQIIAYVKENFGYTPKTCWIADVKEQKGIPMRQAYNRIDKEKRKYPCPANKIEDLKNAIEELMAQKGG